jgi:hypothetical protein
MKNKTVRPVGRPSDYSDETADMICEAIATGGALYKLCERKDWPTQSTIYLWLEKNKEFSEKYARARERQADLRNEEIVEIADNAKDANLARLQVDARKWQASKLWPKKYGDKVAIGGDGDSPLVIKHITRKIVEPGDSDSEGLPPAVGASEV